ncbi:hypothetical protein Cycma_1600 [Cyclobacterium marinum DSM 745]|uniref:Uncharacterized protein n=1 Tax=Cyclobacterium marinum (strain ATCC 25205 / DSM 745 / LMG 13164 / NCIMB 1802) TaxID=880070 RepID=G0J5Q5_CYCMS|nr:hypothetical protein Cycma_1600 [Cyclobacterium marinum DSM 745]
MNVSANLLGQPNFQFMFDPLIGGSYSSSLFSLFFKLFIA